MKDYSLNPEDSKKFILNYTIKDNKITIHYANGDENSDIPYTIEEEKKLLEKMKEQVLQSDKFIPEQEKRFSKAWKWAICSVSMFVLDVVNFATNNGFLQVISGIIACWLVYDIGYRIYNMVDSKRKINDRKKNIILLNNEKRLNEKVKENHNVLDNTNKKIKEMVSSTPVEQPVFTLNSIDKIKYRELKKILEIIDKQEAFDFDSSSVSDEKTFVKKKENRNSEKFSNE